MIERRDLYRSTVNNLVSSGTPFVEQLRCVYHQPGEADVLLLLTTAQKAWKPPTPTIAYAVKNAKSVACGNPLGEERELFQDGEGFTRGRLSDGQEVYNLSARQQGDEMIFYRRKLNVVGGNGLPNPFLPCLQLPLATWQFIDRDLTEISRYKRTHIVQSGMDVAERILSDNGAIPVAGRLQLYATDIAPLQQTLLQPRN